MNTNKLQKAINACYTVQELCAIHQTTVVTVHAWRKRGMPCVVIEGASRPAIRFVKREADKWIEKNIKKKEK